MNKKVIIAVVVVIVVAGGIALALSGNKDNTPVSTNNSNGAASTNNSNQSTANADTNYTINANDTGADVESISVKQGDTIKVTFKVNADGVYHGGLQFKSDVVDSEGIPPGKSGTVTFVADKSFDFTPYWFQGQVKKDFLISVKVQ
jgi:plastocyanin